MRKILSIVCLLLAASAWNASASEGMDDFVKLVKNGSSEDVLRAYVEASAIPYAPTVDEILYLNDLGVPSEVISDMVKHGKDLRAAAEKNAPVPGVPPPVQPPELRE